MRPRFAVFSAVMTAWLAAGCSDAGARRALVAEAERDFPEIEQALADYYDEHDRYPDELDELGLAQALTTLDSPQPDGTFDGGFYYTYHPGRVSRDRPTNCRYELNLVEGNWLGEGPDEVHVAAGHDACDPVLVAEEQRRRDAEAAEQERQRAADDAGDQRELMSITAALDAYFSAHGAFPPTLDELDLGEGATVSHNGHAYDYAVYLPDGLASPEELAELAADAPLCGYHLEQAPLWESDRYQYEDRCPD